MKKLIATIGVSFVLALMTLGLAGTAQAADYGDQDTGTETTTPGGVDNAAASPTQGALPNTGGPQTLLLVGGATLLVAGGTAIVVVRRRSDA